MTNQNEFQAYLQDSSAQPKRFFTEEPSPLPPPIQKASNGLAPMERIALEGQAYRGLASGSQPWWVIISGWVIFGMPCLLVVVAMVSLGGALELLGAIALCLVFLWILYRGTRAKLAQQKAQEQRRQKYRSGMND